MPRKVNKNRKQHKINEDTGIEEKHCGKCYTWKPLEAYGKHKDKWDKLYTCCKPCANKIGNRRRRELMQTKEGREHIRAQGRKYGKKRQMNGKRNAYRNKRYKEDSAFRTKKNMRDRIRMCFSKHGVKKTAKTREIMGCTPEFLNAHLEKYFIGSMSWENRGKWHIDHVVPCVAFGVSLEEQKILHWYDNLRPMWRTDNLHKSGKYEKKDKIALIERYNKANSTNYMQECLNEFYREQLIANKIKIQPTNLMRQIKESRWYDAFHIMQEEEREATLVLTKYFYKNSTGSELDYVFAFFLLNDNDTIFKITAKVDASEFDFKPFDYEEDDNEQNNILQFLIEHNEFWLKRQKF